MGLLRRMQRALGKKDQKEAAKVALTEIAAPLVPAAAGRPAGFLTNPHQPVIARSVEWELIVHPEIKEYTLRVKDVPDDLIVFDFDVVAEIVQEHGVLWNPRKDKPPIGGALLCKGKTPDTREWYLTIDRFINVVLDRADAVARTQVQVDDDEKAEKAMLDDEKAEAEEKQP